MRPLFWTIFTLLVFGVVAYAQQPGGERSPIIPTPGSGNGPAPGQLTLNPNDRRDALLMQWEKAMQGVDSVLLRDCRRTEKKGNDVKVWEGEARFLKPNLGALRLIQKDSPNIYELFVSTGTYLYEYRGEFKKLYVHELPATQPGIFNQSLLGFLFKMNAIQAKGTYDLTLAKDVSQQNPHYIYINILPRYPEDKKEFARAQMVLFAETMLPRRLWYETPGGSEVTWDLPNMDLKTPLKPTDFRPPDAPKGWETVQVPLRPTNNPNDGKPRIIRPTSDR